MSIRKWKLLSRLNQDFLGESFKKPKRVQESDCRILKIPSVTHQLACDLVKTLSTSVS